MSYAARPFDASLFLVRIPYTDGLQSTLFTPSFVADQMDPDGEWTLDESPQCIVYMYMALYIARGEDIFSPEADPFVTNEELHLLSRAIALSELDFCSELVTEGDTLDILEVLRFQKFIQNVMIQRGMVE